MFPFYGPMELMESAFLADFVQIRESANVPLLADVTLEELHVDLKSLANDSARRTHEVFKESFRSGIYLRAAGVLMSPCLERRETSRSPLLCSMGITKSYQRLWL